MLRNLKGVTGIALAWLCLASSAPAWSATLRECLLAYRMFQLADTKAFLAAPKVKPGKYLLAEETLRELRKRLPESEREKFLDWYYDQFFLSREHAILDNLQSSGPEIGPVTRFETDGQAPHNGYRAARDYLFKLKFDKMKISDLDRAHFELMSWRNSPTASRWWGLGWLFAQNSERTSSSYLGKKRDGDVIFYTEENRIGIEKLRRISDGKLPGKSPEYYSEIESVNPFLKYYPLQPAAGFGNDYPAHVVYTPLSEWRRLKDRLPAALIKKLEKKEQEFDFVGEEQAEGLIAQHRAEIEEIQTAEFLEPQRQKLLERLRAKRIDRGTYLRELKKLKERMSELVDEELEGVEKALARSRGVLDVLQKEVRALRREYIEALLNHSWTQMKERLAKGTKQSDVIDAVSDFYYDFVSIHPYMNGNGRIARLVAEKVLAEHGLPSPIFTYHDMDVSFAREDFRGIFRDAVSLSQQFHENLKLLVDNQVPAQSLPLPYVAGRADFKGSQSADEFMAWVAANRSKKPTTLEEVVAEYQKWHGANSYQGDSTRGVRLASPLFVETFGRVSHSYEDFRTKRDAFYSKEPVYRALQTDTLPTAEELAAKFVGTHESAGEKREVFQGYNQDLVRSPSSLGNGVWSGWFSFGKNSWRRFYSDAETAAQQPEGAGPVKIEIEAVRREVGSVDGSSRTATINPNNGKGKPPPLYVYGGYDADSLQKVSASDGTTIRTAQRVAWNIIEVTESDGKPSYFELMPTGKVKKLRGKPKTLERAEEDDDAPATPRRRTASR